MRIQLGGTNSALYRVNYKLLLWWMVLMQLGSLCGQSLSNDSLHHDFFVFNQGQDTLQLDRPDVGIRMPALYGPSTFRYLEINGQGRPEVILYRAFSGFKAQHGGSFDISERTHLGRYEIWDLDTQTQLLVAPTIYSFDCANFIAYAQPQYRRGACSYHYDFSIDELGTVELRELAQSQDFICSDSTFSCSPAPCVPPLAEGRYRFMDGKYQQVD
ncbi:MAG: hypothetical protein AAF433_09220 [Bacteroidota bacterium]